MAKRVRLSKEDVEVLAEGGEVELQMSPKRVLVLGTMSEVELKKEALKRKYEAKLAELESK